MDDVNLLAFCRACGAIMTRDGRGRRPENHQAQGDDQRNRTQSDSADEPRVSKAVSRLSHAFNSLVDAYTATSKQDADRNVVKDTREKRTLRWIVTYTIITAGLFGLGGYQSFITRQTEIVGFRAMIISNSMRFISYQQPSDVDRKWQIAPIIENVGNTPTRHLSYGSMMALCSGVPPDVQTVNKLVRETGAEPGGIRIPIGPKSDIDGVTLEASRISLNCPIAISAYGIVRYGDIFGYRHVTEFCYALGSIDEFVDYPAGQAIRLQAKPCQHSNCADDECGPQWEALAAEPSAAPP